MFGKEGRSDQTGASLRATASARKLFTLLHEMPTGLTSLFCCSCRSLKTYVLNLESNYVFTIGGIVGTSATEGNFDKMII